MFKGKNTIKRVILFTLVLVMLIMAFPIGAAAETTVEGLVIYSGNDITAMDVLAPGIIRAHSRLVANGTNSWYEINIYFTDNGYSEGQPPQIWGKQSWSTGDNEYYIEKTSGMATLYLRTHNGHTYDHEEVDDKWFASAATCTEPKKYYKHCICGATTTSAVFSVGDPLGHDWSNKNGICKRNGDHVCNHAGTTDPCVCSICGKTLHTHAWVYSASGAALTAGCTNSCPLPNGFEHILTLLANDAVYTGSKYTGASLNSSEKTSWQSAGLSVPTIMYVGRGDTEYDLSSVAPTNVGTYTASISIGTGDDAVTAVKEFEITKKDLTAADFSISNQSTSYTGDEKEAAFSLKSTYTGLGEITTKYAIKSSGDVPSTTLPVESGVYEIYVSVTEGDNFNACELLDTGKTLTINKVTPQSIQIEASNINPVYEDTYTITVSAIKVGENADNPTGTINVKDTNDSNKVIASFALNENAEGSFSISVEQDNLLKAGVHALLAEFVADGDSNYINSSSSKKTITVQQRPVVFDVVGQTAMYADNRKQHITIQGNGTKKLSSEDFTVNYYSINQNLVELYSTTPEKQVVAPGKYLYYIKFNNTDGPHKSIFPNYVIGAPTYTLSKTNVPAAENTYNDAGFLLVKEGQEGAQIPIYFDDTIVNVSILKSLDSPSVLNGLNNENGTVPTYKSSNTNVATIASDGAVTIKAPGTTTIIAESQKNGTSPVYASYTLNVLKADVNIISFTQPGMIYGDEIPAASASIEEYKGDGQFTTSVAIDTSGVLTAGKHTATLTVSDVNGRYNTATKTCEFYVSKAALQVTPKAISRMYGTQNPTFELEFSGFKNGDTSESAIIVNPVASSVADTNSPVGTYPIKAQSGFAENYNFVFHDGVLTVTKVSGGALAISGVGSTVNVGDAYSLSANYKLGNSIILPNVNWTSSNASVAAVSDNGALSVLQSGTTTITAIINDSNYETTSASIVVKANKANVFIAIGNQVVTYNGCTQSITAESQNESFTPVLTGPGANMKADYVLTTDATQTTPKAVGQYAVNWKLTDEGYASAGTGTMTINKVDLTVRARDQVKTYGDIAPRHTVYELLGDDINDQDYRDSVDNMFVYSSDADTPLADVGTYDINMALAAGRSLTEDHNYNFSISSTKGQFTVNKKNITISAIEQNTVYGQPIASQPSNVTVEGLVNGDQLVLITLTPDSVGIDATKLTPMNAKIMRGSKDVTSNYAISYVDGPHTVRYQVSFNSNGGSSVEPQLTTGYAIKPADPTRSGFVFGGWYSDSAFKSAWNFDLDTTEDNLTLYAKWLANSSNPVETSEGSVKNASTGAVIANAKVELVRGPEVVASTVTDEEGKYNLGYQQPGDYNLVITDHGKVITTKLIQIEEGSDMDLQLVEKDINTKVKIVAEGLSNPNVVVGRLDAEGETQVIIEGCNKEDVTLTLKSVPVDGSPAARASIGAIEEAKGKNLEFVDISILLEYFKDNTLSSSAILHDTTQVIEIIMPYDTSSRKDIKVIRYHDDGTNPAEVSVFTKLNERRANVGEYQDGEYYVGDGYLVIYATKFSEYALAYTVDSGSIGGGGLGGGSGSSKTTPCPQDETCVYAHFTDADPKAWYHSGVHYCVENKYMNGISYDIFQPKGTLSRAQIVMILWNMEKNPEVNYDMTFKDVVANAWYAEAIRWAQSTGVVEGYDEECFGPKDNVTREQLAAILMRYAKYKGIDVSARSDLAGFTDVDKISGWALENVKWANAVGIINGRTTTTIVPKGDSTRAEAACMVQRFCENILKK